MGRFWIYHQQCEIHSTTSFSDDEKLGNLYAFSTLKQFVTLMGNDSQRVRWRNSGAARADTSVFEVAVGMMPPTRPHTLESNAGARRLRCLPQRQVPLVRHRSTLLLETRLKRAPRPLRYGGRLCAVKKRTGAEEWKNGLERRLCVVKNGLDQKSLDRRDWRATFVRGRAARLRCRCTTLQSIDLLPQSTAPVAGSTSPPPGPIFHIGH
jgi:hypothetical protein